MKLVYLKENVVAEPLIWQWHAWPYLVSPITAAHYLVNKHLPIMESFVQAPEIHEQASQDPKFAGGPFIALNKTFVDDVKELIVKTISHESTHIQLVEAFKILKELLAREATGVSIESLYSKIPDSLKGLVELVYDINHHSAIRLIEPLIYAKYYKDNHQEFVLTAAQTDRKFIFSSPHIRNENNCYINLPFSDERYDTLFSSRVSPIDIEALAKEMNIATHKLALFKSLFAATAPTLDDKRNYHADGVRLRYFGHACVLLQTNALSLLIDPALGYKNERQKYSFAELPDVIDYVLLTHNHQDHVLLETLLQLRYKIKHIVFASNLKGSLLDPSLKLILKHLGFKSLIAMDELESITIPGGEIIGLPFLGEHGDLNIQTKMAFYVKLKDKKFMFVADSNNIDNDLYKHVFKLIGAIDVLFVGMECHGAPLSWMYGPLFSKPMPYQHDTARRLSGSNSEKALAMVESSGCKNVYIYAMGQEPWLRHITSIVYDENSLPILESNKLIAKCQEKNIPAARLFGQKELLF